MSFIGFATLPANDITVGYHRLVPLRYAFSLVYDYRGHASLPTEHWVDGSMCCGYVLLTHSMFRIVTPAAFVPAIAKLMAMRWSS